MPLCLIPPMQCELFERICEEHGIEYEFVEHEDDGMHVIMTLEAYCLYRGFYHCQEYPKYFQEDLA